MRPIFSILFFLLVNFYSVQAQNTLRSGPMLGYIELREALIWLQTKESATVQVEYWAKSNPKKVLRTPATQTNADYDHALRVVIPLLEPGTAYGYRIILNKKPIQVKVPTEFTTQTLWQWRTDPPEFSVALGSCAYINEEQYDRPGRGYGSESEIFTSIAAKKPNLMLWLGDNTYLRDPDWHTRSGILHRYGHTRALAEMQNLLATSHNYAVWDDHDFGPNDSDRNWVRKDMTLDIFNAFWGNPPEARGPRNGITNMFQYNDVDFFMLDNRWFRTANRCKTCDCVYLGDEQLDWLVESLAFSFAPFKIIMNGGQVLNTTKSHETYINLCAAERDTLLARIEREGITGVVFLTGDRHFSELSSLVNASGHTVMDWTVSSLTAGLYKNPKEENAHRVEGTLADVHNFGMLKFSGPRTERKMEMTLYDKDGISLWSRVYEAPKKPKSNKN